MVCEATSHVEVPVTLSSSSLLMLLTKQQNKVHPGAWVPGTCAGDQMQSLPPDFGLVQTLLLLASEEWTSRWKGSAGSFK